MVLHHRTYDHRGTEDCESVVLSAAIGRYAAGTSLCDVLVSMAERLAQLQGDYNHGFASISLSAWVVPSGGAGALGFIGIYSLIRDVLSVNLGVDAVVAASTPIARTSTFGISAYIHEAAAGVTQLAAAIDASQTTITVTSFADFPLVGDFLIQIDGEIMLVTGGHGTTTWTVIRGYGATTAAAHFAGAVVVAC